MIFNIHIIDHLVVLAYFAMVLFIGVFLGGKKTSTLGDFFVAGGKWGAVVSFIFIFASSLAGNEAVVVSGEAYTGGLSGVWFWWNFLFATPIYFLFATFYRRARVYNLAEFLEMRFGTDVAVVYALVAGIICILFIGMFVLAIAKILGGITGLDQQIMVWSIAVIVSAYVFAGGMMSSLLTDLVQGVMCLLILGTVLLPFLWIEAGGYEALRALPERTWDFTSDTMPLHRVMALNVAALVGGIAAPWIYNWMAVSKNEKAATQCGWGHLWKRIVTLVFAVYGILIAIILPGLADPETGLGGAINHVIPVGVGLIGLLIASFFAAAMSSADTYAITASAMFVDYTYRRKFHSKASYQHILLIARICTVFSIILAAVSTLFIEDIWSYVNIVMALLAFLGIPIYFGIAWRRANQTGMWFALILGIGSYATIRYGIPYYHEAWNDEAVIFSTSVFASTTLAFLGMLIGSLLGPPEDDRKLNRFYLIMSTPIGQEQALVDAGISLPSLRDAKLIPEGPEQINDEQLAHHYALSAQRKVFGPDSTIELRREPTHPWYIPGFIRITLACFALVGVTWLVTRILFIW